MMDAQRNAMVKSPEIRPQSAWRARVMRPMISLYGKKHMINIGKDVIRALGHPAYIGLRVNANSDALLIHPCAAKEPMSFRVPEQLMVAKGCSLRITSIQFLRELYFRNGLDDLGTYRIFGEYLPSGNALLFRVRASGRLIRAVSAEEDAR